MSPSDPLRGPAVTESPRPEISDEMMEIARSLGTYALTDTMNFTELDVYVDGLPDEPLNAAEDLARAWAELINESMVEDFSEATFQAWAHGSLLLQSMSPAMARPVMYSLDELVQADAGQHPWAQVRDGLVKDVYRYLQECRWASRSGMWEVSEGVLGVHVGPKRSEAHRKAFCGVLLFVWASIHSESDSLDVLRQIV